MYSEWGILPWASDVKVGNFSLEEVLAIIGVLVAVLGLVGNFLLAATMRTRVLQGVSSSVLVIALACSDSVVLVFEMADDVATLIPDVSAATLVHGGSVWRCRIGVFLYDWTRVVSAWLVVALAVELFMGHVFPRRRPLVFNHMRAFYVVMAVCLIALAGCFPFLVITSASSRETCSSKYRLFFDVYNDVVLDVVTCCLVPVIFIVIANVRSAFTLLDGGGLEAINAETEVDAQGKSLYGKHTGALASFSLAISTLYALAVLPAGAMETMLVVKRHQPSLKLPPMADLGLAFTICRLLLLFNYAAKFYIGLFASKECRSALRRITSYGRIQRGPSSYLGPPHHVTRLSSVAEARF